ncbi:MAG TPA: dihydrodipicolinate reductase C-terminal domain-containing protein [Candidatus Eisenbacteria bacterium]|nr:dihydrodipicolinate reductase C-terminal domain-containing protein [Candidatus Eisenbacteria bacterium]
MSPIQLVLVGASGRMGSEIRRLLANGETGDAFSLAACVAQGGAEGACPEGCRWIEAGRFGAAELGGLPGDAVVLDVSLTTGTEALVSALETSPRAAVLATTGLSPALEARIASLGRNAPVLRAKNLSLGIAVARRWLALLPAAARAAYVADVVEQHHAGKKDAPSGTALDLVAALGAMGTGGDPRRAERPVATHSLRAGTVPGTHRVILSGDGETLELVHTVYDRSVFARGALRAARFVHGKPAGLYSVDDLIHESRGS